MRNKRFTLFLLALLFAQFSILEAQQPRYPLTPDQLETRKLDRTPVGAFSAGDVALPGAHQIRQYTPAPIQSSKTQAVTALGTSSNVYTTLRAHQNQLIAIDSLQTIAFIHRQDVSIWGGGDTENGRYRYDISSDGGATWAVDVGYLQQLYTNYGRYPNIAAHNDLNSSNPLDLSLVYAGPTTRFPLPGWVGHVYGVSETSLTPGATVSATDRYLFDSDPVSFIQGSLVQGLPGEYWAVENQWDGNSAITDSIRIFKGVWNSNNSDVDWTLYLTMAPGYDKTFDGTPYGSSPVMAFSPDGMDGWIAMTGNILNGTDTRQGTILPIFIKTSDGGVTWNPAYEVDLGAISWIQDSLQGPTWGTGSGLPFCIFQNFDLTVDKNGNPHLGIVIYNAGPADDYSFEPGLEKILADVYSLDGGTTWDASYLAPVLTYSNNYGTNMVVSQSNYVQAARTESGSHLFFSWADSDTSQFTGSMNGVGFGESNNLAPNIRIVAKRVSDNGQTYPRTISDADLNWGGSILYPTMSPIVIEKGGQWHLPIVATDMPNEPDNPVGFYYWGNDATIPTNADFCIWQLMSLGWNFWGDPNWTPAPGDCTVNVEEGIGQKETLVHTCFPNPTSGDAVIRFNLKELAHLDITLRNMYGQTVAQLGNGDYTTGRHNIEVKTSELASGIYFYSIRTAVEGLDSEVYTGKIVLKQ